MEQKYSTLECQILSNLDEPKHDLEHSKHKKRKQVSSK